MCACESISPGITAAPRASMRRVDAPMWALLFSPTARILPSFTASAETRACFGFTV